jgi:hypothetical protein
MEDVICLAGVVWLHQNRNQGALPLLIVVLLFAGVVFVASIVAI